MNWSVVAILATVGVAQAGLVVGLVDRLFKAEIRVLTAVIEGLKKELEKREAMDGNRDDQITDLQHRVQRIGDRLENCLHGSPKCAKKPKSPEDSMSAELSLEPTDGLEPSTC